MEKIELTDQELDVLKRHVAKTLDFYGATPQEREALMSVVDKMTYFADEMNAWGEENGNTDKWFLNLYQKQQQESK